MNFAGFIVSGHDERTRCGQGAVDRHRQQALLDQSAVLGARGQFLTHVAALAPGDAVQFIEPGLQQHGLVRLKIARAVG